MQLSVSDIETESEKALTVGQELALMRAAFGLNPTDAVRSRLAQLLILDDVFDEAIDIISSMTDRGFREEMMLNHAYISHEDIASDELARVAADRAQIIAKNDVERATALAARGKCERRLRMVPAAMSSFHKALQLDPHNKDACKRLAAIKLDEERPKELLALTDELLAQGVGHARLFGARVLAHAQMGNVEEAREAEGFERFHTREYLTSPPGWGSIAEFNAALAKELLDHPDMRFERYGSASTLTWRIESPLRQNTPLFGALINQIIAAVGRRITEVEKSNHVWARSRPDASLLRNWCVITEDTGFESWHVHQFGWLSGVYYVQVPDAISTGTSRDGCIAFGLPDELVGSQASADYGINFVRPEDGLLLTFPSHVYHRTYPHGGNEKRICVAFDLRHV